MEEQKPLDEILERYENIRDSFRTFSNTGVDNKDTLHEFQLKFIDIRADLRYWHKKIGGEYARRDDKNATGIKYRICVAISEGKLLGEDGKPIYPACSINQAEKFASGSEKYKEFLNSRTFYKESYINLSDVREDLQNYITLIRDRANR